MALIRQGVVTGDRASRSDPENGSATIWMVAVVSLVLMLLFTFLSGSAIYAKRAWLQGVADMAALTAADSAPTSMALAGPELSETFRQAGCAAAEVVATSNNAVVGTCQTRSEPTDLDFYVTLKSDVVVLGLPLTIQVRSRAGPLGLP